MPLPALLGPIASGLGGLLGGLFGGGEKERAEKARAQALERILGISVPTLEEQEVVLERMRSAGTLTPEMEDAIVQETSKMEGVSTDPRLANAQMSALEKLTKSGQEGLTAEDRMALNQVRRDVSREDQNRQQAILQNMSQRGVGGSGAELAAQLASSQASAERASSEGDRLAAMAQNKALQSLMQSGQLAGSMRGQEFGEKSAIAQAQDEINRFNTANKQNVQSRNVGSRNQAQQMNLANAQSIMNANTGLSNQQQMHNKALLQQQYQNKLAQQKAAADALESSAKGNDRNAANTAAIFSGVGGAVNTAITGAQKADSTSNPYIPNKDVYDQIDEGTLTENGYFGSFGNKPKKPSPFKL